MNVSDRTRSIAVAVALGLAAAVIIVLAVKKTGGGSKASKGDVTVYVAKSDIPTGTPGSDIGGKIDTQHVPKDSVVAGAISSTAQVQNLVTTGTIFAGEQVTIRRFQAQEAEGVPGQILGNQRAFQVPGDTNQLLVGTLQAGDHVDVVANVKYKLSNFRQGNTAITGGSVDVEYTASRVVLRNILVLQEPETPKGGSRFASDSAYAALLSVSDSQAQKLFYVMQNGAWTLVLRPRHNSNDSPNSVETSGSILADGLRPPQFFQLVQGTGGP